jgi:arylsulfatase A-like enzyme
LEKGLHVPNGKPNILMIWGDDIGISNLSCYSRGMRGYRTPNIDRIASKGMRFTDSYGEQSCTAVSSSFITGQSVYRTKEFPPRHPPASFSIDQAVEKLQKFLTKE